MSIFSYSMCSRNRWTSSSKQICSNTSCSSTNHHHFHRPCFGCLLIDEPPQLATFCYSWCCAIPPPSSSLSSSGESEFELTEFGNSLLWGQQFCVSCSRVSNYTTSTGTGGRCWVVGLLASWPGCVVAVGGRCSCWGTFVYESNSTISAGQEILTENNTSKFVPYSSIANAHLTISESKDANLEKFFHYDFCRILTCYSLLVKVIVLYCESYILIWESIYVSFVKGLINLLGKSKNAKVKVFEGQIKLNLLLLPVLPLDKTDKVIITITKANLRNRLSFKRNGYSATTTASNTADTATFANAAGVVVVGKAEGQCRPSAGFREIGVNQSS